MQLKEALEAATENVDVRPGFIGDVMTGARRRRTRNRVRLAGVVVVVAGLVGFLLGHEWRPSQPQTHTTSAANGDSMGFSPQDQGASSPLPPEGATYVLGSPAPPPADDVLRQAIGASQLSRWRAVGSFVAGESVVVTTVDAQAGKQLVGAVYSSPDRVDHVVRGAIIVPETTLALLAIPGRGWVAIAEGSTLVYRIGREEPWSVPATNAALLPATAVQLLYTRNGRSTAVDLS